MGKKKRAPQPQSINLAEILKERFQNDQIEVRPCLLIPAGAKINEEKDYIVTIRYLGEDLSPILDSLLSHAKEEIEMGNARVYLHACRKKFSDNNKLLIKGLSLYYRLKSLKARR